MEDNKTPGTQAEEQTVPDKQPTEDPQHAAAETEEKQTAEPLTDEELKEIDERVINAIQTCYDPEIPVNIYELGLIYQVRVKRDHTVNVDMTLTSPNCPAAQSLPAEVKEKVESVDKVKSADVTIVWDPPWGPHMMSEAAKLELGFF